ncbi:MAG: Asp-tRNA(Asn)/Glu-tRNA(Gln) amidotransferase GatCAB subunit A [Hyphomicrobiales bacterium]|nr:Asp-tRNA(Asn)/Glu-tRNA(Gln) amidotransferase GatCAB subunit A [Hyphomicrobiales bacterium]
MSADALAYVGVAEAASKIAEGRLSAVELIERLLERIEAVDPILNSYITVMADSAREAAREADVTARAGKPLGPLHGVPIALKDLYATKDVRTTFACAAFADWTPDYDATVVTRLKQAGAIIIGKQNMHEAAAGSSSLVSHFGPVRNPWNVDYIAGGSSGGSAAALAAGLAAGALGSDTAMSIRQPAAYCGVVGLKPTFGRVSKHGALTLSWSLDHAGPMARSSRDAALLLQTIAGFDPQDPSSADIEVPDYLSALTGDLTGLRIGIPRRHFFEQCSPAVLAALELAIETLRRLGATVSDCELPAPEDTLMFGRAILRIEASAYHAERLSKRPELLSPGLRDMVEGGAQFSAVQYLHAQRIRNVLSQEFARAMEPYDALVTPTTPWPAERIAEDQPSKTGPRMRNTMPFNFAGLPAISTPCGFDERGLPIGLQVVGHSFDEATTLRIADAYELATEWIRRRPTLIQQ